jgi:hypothetical protein
MDVALPLVATHEDLSHAQTEAEKSTWFIEWVQDILHKYNGKYK